MPAADFATPEETIRLRLPLEAWLAGVGGVSFIGLFLLGVVVFVAKDTSWEMEEAAAFLACGLFGGICGYGWMRRWGVREVVFGEEIVVRYRLRGPDRHICYEDICDIGLGRLVARSAALRWKDYANADEVYEAIEARIESGHIPSDQLDSRALITDVAWMRSNYLGLPVMLVTAAGLWIFLAGEAPAGGTPALKPILLVAACLALPVQGLAFLFFRRRLGADLLPPEA